MLLLHLQKLKRIKTQYVYKNFIFNISVQQYIIHKLHKVSNNRPKHDIFVFFYKYIKYI